ncbi:MAG: hypothetical protein Q8L98_05600 [Chlamydiales bacterium]|nr:hypothetical protein [Chlamydiales bacterium]
MRKSIIYLTWLFIASCSLDRRETILLTPYERSCLDCFFRILLSEPAAAGYSIYGKKPLSVESFVKNDISVSTRDDLGREEAIFKEGARIWERSGLSQRTHNIVICSTDEISSTGVNDLFIINRQEFIRVVQENLPLFQYVLGPKITPSALLDQFIREKKPLLSVLNEDRTLTGIVLGYGAQNALHVSRLENLMEFSSQYSPSFGFATIQDEMDVLSKEETVLRHLHPELKPPLPWFGSISSPETDELFSHYRASQKKLSRLLQSPHFLEEVLSELLDRNISIGPISPLIPLLEEKVRQEPNLPYYLGKALRIELQVNSKHLNFPDFIRGMEDAEEKKGNSFIEEKLSIVRREDKEEVSFIFGQRFWDRFYQQIPLKEVLDGLLDETPVDLSDKWEAIEQLDLLCYIRRPVES